MNYERMGELLAETALSLGWPNDGDEGAQEYVMRVCRQVALTDAEARRGLALKRYVLFGGCTYYASGGWRDMQDSYVDLESACTAAQELMKLDWHDWWQIVDVNSGLIVSQSENQAHC